MIGKKFLLRSDHGSLYWLFNLAHPEGQIARWLKILGAFDFKIEHRSGAKHGNADSLSRIPCTQCGKGVENGDNDKSEDLRAKARRLSKPKEKQNLKSPKTLRLKLQNCVNVPR